VKSTAQRASKPSPKVGELFRSDLEDRKVERLRRDQDFMEVPFYDPEAHLTGRGILEQSERNRESCVL
jgi:hypothetical protein